MSLQDVYKKAMAEGDYDAAEAVLSQIEAEQTTQLDANKSAQYNHGQAVDNSAAEYNTADTNRQAANIQEAIEAQTPYGALRYETRHAPAWDRAMLGAGHRTTQLGDGLANIGDALLAGFGSNDAQDRLDERIINDFDISQYKEDLVSDTGVAGVLGEFLPYYLSGVAAGPIVTKAANKVLGGVVDMANVPIKATGRGIGNVNDAWLKSSGDAGERIATDLSAGLKAHPLDILAQKAGAIPRWMDSRVIDPARISAAAKAMSAKDMPLVPLLAGTGSQMAGQTLLGLGEGAIDSEKTWREGAIQGAIGGAMATYLRPKLTNAVDVKKPLYKVSTAESELMKRVKRNYGINSDIGMEWGLPSDQVKMANFRHRPGTQNMADQYDANQERKIANMIADGLGMKRPENGFTHADFAAHAAELDKGYKAIADGTYGEFGHNTMTKVNAHTANILNDPSIPKDVKDLVNKYRLAMHGYQNTDKTFTAAPYDMNTHARIRKDLHKIYNDLEVAPTHDEILLAEQKYARAKLFEDSWKKDPSLTPEEAANHAAATRAAAAELKELRRMEKEAPTAASRKLVQKSINDIERKLRFNVEKQGAGKFVTTDALGFVDNEISKIKSHLDEIGARGDNYQNAAKAHEDIIKALDPLKSHMATRDASGNMIVDGYKLKNLREDLKGDINDFTLRQESRKANALKPLLEELDNATKYKNGMTAELADDIRRKYALLKIAESNRFVNAGLRPDLTAVTKWVESEDELGRLMQGKASIPQKQALHDAAAYHRLMLRQRRSNQNNIGAVEEASNRLDSTPADSRASMADLLKFKLHTTGLGPHIPGFGPLVPKGYPGSTGWLNLNHSGPASVYPLLHGVEQAANLSGRAKKQYDETYKDLKDKYRKWQNN